MPFRPVGIFDSGIGGMSVLIAVKKRMPNESIVYLADKQNMPYGGKTPSEIKTIAAENTRTLFAMNCKAVVIACNTATENAVGYVRKLFPHEIVIGLEPAVKPCLNELSDSGYAVALVTEATSRSLRFETLVKQCGNRIAVAPQKMLAAAVENAGTADEVKDIVFEALKPFGDAESVVIGCSHYSFVTPFIEEFYGGKIKIYDGAEGAAERLYNVLEGRGLLNVRGGKSRVEFYSTVNR